MSREKLSHILLGALIAIAFIVPLGAYAFVKSGVYNVAAAHPHTNFTTWLTHDTMIHSVRRRASGLHAPRVLGSRQIMAGFCAYETHCVACHGAPAIAREQWVSGMEPSPPYLVDATTNWNPSELFWISRNGIKMTAMPSWRNSMSDAQIWDVVGFIEAIRQMPPQTYLRWRSRHMCGGVNGPWPQPG